MYKVLYIPVGAEFLPSTIAPPNKAQCFLVLVSSYSQLTKKKAHVVTILEVPSSGKI